MTDLPHLIMGITALIKTDRHATGGKCGEVERGERQSYQKGAEMDRQKGEQSGETSSLRKLIPAFLQTAIPFGLRARQDKMAFSVLLTLASACPIP